MPNNGNDWNRNREGSIWDRNENEGRNDRNRGDYDNDFNQRRNERSERDYGNQGRNYMGSNYNRDDNYREARGGYGRGNDWDMGGTDYPSSRGYGNSSMNRGSGYSSGRDSDWSMGHMGAPGSGYGSYGAGTGFGNYNERSGDRFNYDDRYGQGGYRGNERGWWDKTKDEVSSWFGDEDAERRRNMDERQGHRGKGPKGYTRSDERVKEDVNDRLSDDAQVDASDIDVSVSKGEVTLTGTVKTRWEKRRAEDLAEAVSGVKNVENRLRVGSSSQSGSMSGTSGGSSMTSGLSGTGASNIESGYSSSNATTSGTSDTGRKR